MSDLIISFFATDYESNFETGAYKTPPPADTTYVRDVWEQLQNTKIGKPVAVPLKKVDGKDVPDEDAFWPQFDPVKDRHLMVRVSTVEKMSEWLNIFFSPMTRYPGDKAIIQIVAGGKSGSLGLGAIWKADVKPESPFWVFDSTPAALGLLLRFGANISRAVLAGCNVADAPESGSSAHGSVLLLALSLLWGCDVTGAIDLVAANQFNDQGLFAGPQRNWHYAIAGVR